MLPAGVASGGCASGQATPATDVTDTGGDAERNATSAAMESSALLVRVRQDTQLGSETSHQTTRSATAIPHPVSASVTGLMLGPSIITNCVPSIRDRAPPAEPIRRRRPPRQWICRYLDSALFPSFDPKVSDYVGRCDGQNPVTVSSTAPSDTQASIDGQPGQSGRFMQSVQPRPTRGSASRRLRMARQTPITPALSARFPELDGVGGGDSSQDWIRDGQRRPQPHALRGVLRQ